MYRNIIVMFDDFVVTVFAIDELTKLPVTATSPNLTQVATGAQPPSPPAPPQPPQPPSSVEIKPAPMIDPTANTIPQVIENIVFRYIQHQKEIYKLMWSALPDEKSGKADKIQDPIKK